MLRPASHGLPLVIVLALWLCSAAALLAQHTPPSMKFTRLSVKDPGINNIEAVSFLIPAGWKPEGGVQ